MANWTAQEVARLRMAKFTVDALYMQFLALEHALPVCEQAEDILDRLSDSILGAQYYIEKEIKRSEKAYLDQSFRSAENAELERLING